MSQVNLENMDITELAEYPLVIKDAVLMSQGIWNNTFYSQSEILKAYRNTDWTARERRNIFLDHKDLPEKGGGASEWVGEVKELHYDGEMLRGDLVIYDPIWSVKLKYGKPKIGISPKVKGDLDEKNKTIHNFVFENFSLVLNPAVKTAYINNMEVMQMEETDIDALAEAENAKKKQYPYPDEESGMHGKMKGGMSEDEILEAATEILKKKKKYPYSEPQVEDIVKKKEPEPKKDESLEDVFDLFEVFELKGKDLGSIMKKAKAIRKEGEAWKDALKRAAKSMEEDMSAQEAKNKETEALKAQLENQKKQIEVLSQRLNEPATIELTKKMVAPIGDADKGMLEYLKALEGEQNGA